MENYTYTYVDICRTLEILKQDSGILPKPKENWNTFEPKEGDIAYVLENETSFVFNGTDWVVKEDEIEEIDSIEELL